ncbi:MAG TPA: rhodanese-like domain-containing protein, partial [Thermomicrobiales bacterium]|nr:rhodanese-like domain-containing protein [Thermomicrobiales bacterium]
GEQRLSNYAFRPQTREQFIESVLANTPPPPTYYPVLKKINKAGATAAGSLAGAASLAPREVRRLQADGALLLDTRDPQAFTRGFIPGSRFAGLGPNFTAWTGWIAPYDRPLVLVVDSPEALEDAVTNLRRIGLDNVAGYVDGGVAGWRSAGLPLHSIEEIDVHALASQMNEPGFAVLDVRSEDEYQAGHIPKARHAFAGQIVQGVDAPISPGERVAVICGTGYRSLVAISELASQGIDGLINVPGGMSTWEEAGLPSTSLIAATV